MNENTCSGELGLGQGGPYVISNVTTPIGQAQPSQHQTAANTYDINVWVSQSTSR